MAQLAKELDFSDGGYVQTIFESSCFDLLDGDLG
jgi:hypothetical protein